MRLRPLLLLFLGSGASGLVYQVVWMRALTLTLSVTVFAVTTVLCAFMGGLALGAFLGGRLADRLERPLLVFGAVELGIGLCGLAVPHALFALAPAYGWLAASLSGAEVALVGARFLLAAAVLLLPCTLMGMTLPLLSRAAVERMEQVGRGAGGLYAVNTLGAVVGCVAAGFVLIPELGLVGTSRLAAAGNLGVGLSAALLGRRAPRRAALASRVAPAAAGPIPPQAALAALGFGISGFTALGYEVLWTRALEQFTHNSTYAYTIMLATFLLGIGGGSAVTAWFAHRVRRPLALFGALELAIGVSVLGSLLVYMSLLDWIPGAAAALGGLASWGRVLALIVAVAGATLLVTTSLFGATFPFVARAMVESERVVGRRVAFAYTVNTVGAILGALAVGFWLLPVLGLRGSFLALLGLNLVTGVVLLRADAPRRTARVAAAVAGLAFAASLLLLPTRLFEAIFAARYGRLLLYREQITDTVMVTEGPDGERFIRYGDGRGTAGTASFREDRSYAHLAMLAHPDPRRVLSICFGVGNSLSSVAQYPIERVDAVELSPGVVHAAPFFRRTNRDVLSDPRVRLQIQDGRNYLLGTRERYDVIRLDPPELHTAGIVNLYTEEFFELAREHLAPGGVFSIWVNIAYTPEPDLRMIVRTAAEIFPHLTIWHSPYLYSWVLNGSVEPRPPDLALLARRFAEAPIRSDLASIGIDDPLELLSYYVMGPAEARAFAGDASVITDDRTRLDYSLPRSVESYFGISNSITNDWLVDLMERRESLVAKSARLCAHKRTVLPHLANPGALGLGPEELEGELDARLLALPHGCTGAALSTGRQPHGERESAGARSPDGDEAPTSAHST
jgi:predicted membrane-bound spermidine synthase